MKKFLVKICSLLILLSVAFSFAGCTYVYYDREECMAHINQFLRAAIERDVNTLSKISYMDSLFKFRMERFKEDPFISKTMETAYFEVYTDNIRQANNKIYYDCFIYYPEYKNSYRHTSELGNYEEFCQAVDAQKKNDYDVQEVTVIFNVGDGIWIVENTSDFISALYEPMMSVLSENREIPSLVPPADSKEDRDAHYKHVLLSDVNFEVAVQGTRQFEPNIKVYEPVTEYDPALTSQGCEAVIESKLKDEEKITYTYYRFPDSNAAKAFFESHTDSSIADIKLQYISSEWGYTKDYTTEIESLWYMNDYHDVVQASMLPALWYWSGNAVVHAAVPTTMAKDEDTVEEYILFWETLGVKT